MNRRLKHLVFFIAGVALFASNSFAAESITDTHVEWPTFKQVMQVLLLGDYNTRLVVLSTAVLGIAAGLIGSFLLLRKRSLTGDALSHATLPGIGIAFMVMVSFGGTGKFLPGLLLGAAISGLLGVGAVMLIRSMTRLKDDAALGIVLSVFFGFGAALLGLIQDMPEGSAAGLESFIYGKTASIIRSDLLLIVAVAVAVAAACAVFYKEFTLLCFDEGYAESQGWPVMFLDLTMLTLVTAVTVIGLQAVGLILIIALLIVPAAAARFWTEHLPKMMLGSAFIGAVSGWFGASLSALVPRLPAGAVIVVVAAVIFGFSMVFGSSRGVLVRAIAHRRLTRTVARQHLLRALFEITERTTPPPLRGGQGGGENVQTEKTASFAAVSIQALLAERSWSRLKLRRLLAAAEREGLVIVGVDSESRLTEPGRIEAARVVRNHRLWEMYLITHADIAPSHVDRDADQIEHVLGAEMVAKLEERLSAQTVTPIPPSPHAI